MNYYRNADNCWFILVDFLQTNAIDNQLGILFQDTFWELDIEIDNALSKIENNNKHKKEIIDTTSTLAEINSNSCLIYNILA